MGRIAHVEHRHAERRATQPHGVDREQQRGVVEGTLVALLVDVAKDFETAGLALMSDLGQIARVATRRRRGADSRGRHAALHAVQLMRSGSAGGPRGGGERRLGVVLHRHRGRCLADTQPEREQVIEGIGQLPASGGGRNHDSYHRQQHPDPPWPAPQLQRPHVLILLPSRGGGS